MSKIRRYSNTAIDTTLNGSITAASTSLLVNSDTNYPNPPFTVAVDSEIILVGDRAGTTFKGLERGYDDTVAASHVDTTALTHKAIADDFSYRWEDTLTTPTWHSLDDEFDDASLDTDWTEVTPTGTATWTEARGILSARFNDQSANDCAGLVRNMGSLVPPIYITTAYRVLHQDQNYAMAGVMFADGTTTTSNVVWVAPYVDTGTWASKTIMRSGTFTNVSTDLTGSNSLHAGYPWLHLRLDWVNSNTWRAWYSPDGVSWTDMDKGSKASTMTPAYLGFGVSSWATGGTDRVATFQHFRVYETKPTWWEDGT